MYIFTHNIHKCLLFNFWMVKLTKTPILPNFQVLKDFFLFFWWSERKYLHIFQAYVVFEKMVKKQEFLVANLMHHPLTFGNLKGFGFKCPTVQCVVPHMYILITQFNRQLNKTNPERNLNLFYNSRFQLLTKWCPNPVRKNGFQPKNIIFPTIDNYGSASLWYYCESWKDSVEKRRWNYSKMHIRLWSFRQSYKYQVP